MRYAFSLWLLAADLAAQVPQLPEITQSPVLAATNAYVRRIDADNTLSLKRHIKTYGHANKPGIDSLFWVYGTDFPCSVVVYFSGNSIVKLVETARASSTFCENTYFLRNNALLFVRQRQVYCPFPTQLTAWQNKTFPFTKVTDCFFRGTYYFNQDSCSSKQERGKPRWDPHYHRPNGRDGKLTEFFPWQAARYLAAFSHPPAPKRR